MVGQKNEQDQGAPRESHPAEYRMTAVGLTLGFLFGLGALGLDLGRSRTSDEEADRQVWSQPIEFLSIWDSEPSTEKPVRSQHALGIDPRGAPFVAYWRDRLAQTPPRVLNAYLSKPDLWKADILPILATHGVPREFLYLALLESGMDPQAQSPARAVGLWQFTGPTARLYGLVVEDHLDERTDQLLATEAAGRYLRDLHKQFGSWELAAAAYNAGPGRVERALTKTGAQSYWDLIEVGHLPAETRAYVPRFLALVELAADRPATVTPTLAIVAD